MSADLDDALERISRARQFLVDNMNAQNEALCVRVLKIMGYDKKGVPLCVSRLLS